MSFYREFRTLKENTEREFKETMEEHERKLERIENEHKKEMRDYEMKITNAMEDYTRAQRKLSTQQSKRGTELKRLKVEKEKEIDDKTKELRDLQEKHESEINERIRQLKMAENEHNEGKRQVAAAMKEEDVARELNTHIFEITKLWMEVDDEMDNINCLMHTDGVENVWKRVLNDMKKRKHEMNERVRGLIERNDLVRFGVAQELLGILPRVGEPLKSLEVLISRAEQGDKNVAGLQKEVQEVASWIHQLRAVTVTANRTVPMILEAKFQNAIRFD